MRILKQVKNCVAVKEWLDQLENDRMQTQQELVKAASRILAYSGRVMDAAAKLQSTGTK